MEGYQNINGGTDLTRLSRSISSNIQKMSQNTQSLRRIVDQLGTSQDSETKRAEVQKLQQYTSSLAKDTNKMLKDLASLPLSVEQKVLKDRLTSDFSAALQAFQAVQRSEAEKARDGVRRARAASSTHAGVPRLGGVPQTSNLIELASPSTPLPPPQQQYQQMEEEVDLEMLRERENVVRQLEEDIRDVNTIFKDLATMVHEQGEIVDSIEANVESSHIRVEEGAQQLQKARQSLQSARKKTFICFIICAIALAVLITVLVYSFKS